MQRQFLLGAGQHGLCVGREWGQCQLPALHQRCHGHQLCRSPRWQRAPMTTIPRGCHQGHEAPGQGMTRQESAPGTYRPAQAVPFPGRNENRSYSHIAGPSTCEICLDTVSLQSTRDWRLSPQQRTPRSCGGWKSKIRLQGWLLRGCEAEPVPSSPQLPVAAGSPQ